MNVHQVVTAAAPHDAVTNDALALRRAARGVGRSEVFAHYVHPDLAGEVGSLADFPESGCDVLVYHVSIGDPEVTSFVLGRPEPVVIVYHNVTPAEFFEPYDPVFAGHLTGGREQLALLRPRVVTALADSGYNADELRALGYDDVAVLPLAVDLDGLLGASDDGAAAAHLAGAGGPVYLFVGQLMPHKRPDLLVQAFHVLSTFVDPTATLVLAGTARLASYGAALEQFVRELALPGVRITGTVSDATLASLYRRADAFVTMSEHEGFCIPLVEAMAFGVPVVARACAAVPETAGDAALLLDPADGAAVVAEALHEVATDTALRTSLSERGRRRAAELTGIDPGERFLAHVRGVLA